MIKFLIAPISEQDGKSKLMKNENIVSIQRKRFQVTASSFYMAIKWKSLEIEEKFFFLIWHICIFVFHCTKYQVWLKSILLPEIVIWHKNVITKQKISKCWMCFPLSLVFWYVIISSLYLGDDCSSLIETRICTSWRVCFPG